MYATRLMLVELIRVVAERLIHLILSDFNPNHIHIVAKAHSFSAEDGVLYDVAVEMGWESTSYEGATWAKSNPSQSHTIVFKPNEEVT